MQGRVAPSGNPVWPGPWPSPRVQLQPAFGGPLARGHGSGRTRSSALPAQPVSSFSSRELKYRAGRQAEEPSFQIRDYVESQKKRPGCCSFL